MMLPNLSYALHRTIRGRKLARAFWLGARVVCAILAVTTSASAGWLDDVGYTQLHNALGSATPNGAGVPISLVEAGGTSLVEAGGTSMIYFPDTHPVPTNPIYTAGTDPFGEAVTFTDDSGGASNGVSSHAASTVGAVFFGNSSPAAGANAVTVYEATNWLQSILHSTGANRDPEIQDFRVQNFSWISVSNEPSDEIESRDTLRRFDFLIDRDNVMAMIGLSNGAADSLPHLFAHSYNAIAVGVTDGSHSTGQTTFYGPGRTKPDIVAPFSTVSSATGALSSAATMLHQVVAGSDAANSETMKAMLLAGATKEEIPGWSRTTTQPLDSHFGAGELNVYNSYLSTLGGQTAGSTDNTGDLVETAPSHGWDYQTASPGGDLFYNFEIPTGSTAAELSVILAWNVEVTDANGPGGTFSGTESLANLDLALYDSTTTFMDTLVDESVSEFDNVEHIYQTGLGPGTYTLKVSSDALNLTDRDFGLAWRLNTLFDVASADFDEDGDIDGSDFLTWQRGFGTLLGASHADGDSDGDGDVDSDDLAAFQIAFNPPPIVAALSVPEPGTLALALLMAAGLWAVRSGRCTATFG